MSPPRLQAARGVDRSLALTAARGDDGALAALVRTYHARVYRFGVRVCRDPFDADDAVQQAFVQLARRPDVVAAPSLLASLMTTIRRACARLWRPFARERRVLGERAEPADLAADGDPQQALARWQLVSAVHRAIAELPAAYREVLVLRDLEGLSAAETCRALGLELAAMKSRLHRARAQLRERLAGATGDAMAELG